RLLTRHTRNSFFFFFNATAPTELYPLSLHDALPISDRGTGRTRRRPARAPGCRATCAEARARGSSDGTARKSRRRCRAARAREAARHPRLRSRRTRAPACRLLRGRRRHGATRGSPILPRIPAGASPFGPLVRNKDVSHLG